MHRPRRQTTLTAVVLTPTTATATATSTATATAIGTVAGMAETGIVGPSGEAVPVHPTTLGTLRALSKRYQC